MAEDIEFSLEELKEVANNLRMFAPTAKALSQLSRGMDFALQAGTAYKALENRVKKAEELLKQRENDERTLRQNNETLLKTLASNFKEKEQALKDEYAQLIDEHKAKRTKLLNDTVELTDDFLVLKTSKEAELEVLDKDIEQKQTLIGRLSERLVTFRENIASLGIKDDGKSD